MAKQPLPPYPKRPTGGETPFFIWAYCALKGDASASRLKALWEKAALAKSKRNEDENALWNGFNTVNEAAKADYLDARKRGELLFAWHGTKATEVQA